MLERVLVLAIIVVALAVTTLAVRWWARRRAAALKTVSGGVLLQALNLQPDGRPVLVTFSTPSCAACHTAQAPAVEQVQQRLGAHGVRVVQVDAAVRPEVARAFGVLTVPSSVVMDAGGQVSAVNHGFATSQRLIQQLQTR